MTIISPATISEAMSRYEALLTTHRDVLDALNVYPVPDGDTGTNLLATISDMSAALAGTSLDGDLGALASVVGEAASRAARGNSGIIVSEALRGFTASLAGSNGDASGLVRALEEASRRARSAVGDPVEGTVLTVAADAATAAAVAAPALDDADVADDVAVARAAADEAWASVARTPLLLPALAEAGVVDAGGAGYALWLDALAVAVGGEVPERALNLPPGGVAVPSVARGPRTLGPRYELVADIDAGPTAIDQLRRAWARVGGSVAVVGDAPRWRAHVHTDDPDAALAIATSLGDVRHCERTDLHQQVAARSPLQPDPSAVCTVVAVAASDELAHQFEALGCAVVVSGGRGARPSGGALADAIARAGGETVLVLPNDGPSVDVARRAAQAADRPVVVVPTRSMMEGLEAMRAFNPRDAAEAVACGMDVGLGRLAWADVLPVVRPAEVDGQVVAPGDWLARGHHPDFTTAGSDPFDAAVLAMHLLIEALDGGVGDRLEAVVLLIGDLGDARADDALRGHVESLFPSAVVETHDTHEPHLAYTIGIRRHD